MDGKWKDECLGLFALSGAAVRTQATKVEHCWPYMMMTLDWGQHQIDLCRWAHWRSK